MMQSNRQDLWASWSEDADRGREEAEGFYAVYRVVTPGLLGLGSEPAASVATGGERGVPGAATLNVPTPAGLGYENADDGFRHPVLRLQEPSRIARP